MPVAVRRPRRRRQVAAVDRRAPGCVRDQHPVTEELGQHLEIRRLAAPFAGARVLEQRLQHLGALHRRRIDERPVDLGDREEEVEPLALDLEVLELGLEVDRAVTDRLLRVRRARVDADPAARAVVGRNLDRHLHPREVLVAPVLRRKAVRCAVEILGREDLHPDRSVRTDDRALGAVDADRRIPDRDLIGDRPLLVAGGSGRERPVDRERAHGQGLAATGQHRGSGPAQTVRGAARTRRERGERLRPRAGTVTSCRPSSAESTAATFRSTTAWPRLP